MRATLLVAILLAAPALAALSPVADSSTLAYRATNDLAPHEDW